MSSGITLEAGHASLKDIIDEAENAKVKRSMYAETQRQKMEVLDAIRNSEWNTEMNPTVVTQQEVPVFHDFSKGFVLAHGGPPVSYLFLPGPFIFPSPLQSGITRQRTYLALFSELFQTLSRICRKHRVLSICSSTYVYNAETFNRLLTLAD
jgi:hypothetical protein